MISRCFAIVLVFALLAGCDSGPNRAPAPTATTPNDATLTVSEPTEVEPTLPKPKDLAPTVAQPTVSDSEPTVSEPTNAITPTSISIAVTGEASDCLSSPLKCSDAPPEGVVRQLSFGGSGMLDPFLSLSLGQSTDLGVNQVGDMARFGIEGVDPNDVLGATFTWPTGQVEHVVTVPRAYDGAYWCWSATPYKPLGEYQIAVQGPISPTTGTFTLVPTEYPIIFGVPEYGPPGTTFTIVLAGFGPGETVPLYLYQAPESFSQFGYFVASLRPVEVDQLGNGTGTLNTQADDPEGAYIIAFGEGERSGLSQWILLRTSPPDLNRCL